MSQLLFKFNQRWRDRRDSYRPAREPIIPSQFGVETIDRSLSKPFVVQHHYSGSMPPNRLSVGLFRRLHRFHSSQLVGVAVFSVPQHPGSIPLRTGVDFEHGIELGRFVLLDDVEANGETWFLSRAFKIARRALGVKAVVSYSDPLRRTADDGSVVLPGHVGTIYQAFNARYVGRTKSRTLHLANCGRELPPRSLSKIRNNERGADAAYSRFLDLGAPKRRRGERPDLYVERALKSFRHVRHPGNHVYSWGLDRLSRDGLPPSLPYPKSVDRKHSCDR